MRISDWSSDVCSSDLAQTPSQAKPPPRQCPGASIGRQMEEWSGQKDARSWRRRVHDRDGAPVALYLDTKASVCAHRHDQLAVRHHAPDRTQDPPFAPNSDGAGTTGRVWRKDDIWGVEDGTRARSPY